MATQETGVRDHSTLDMKIAIACNSVLTGGQERCPEMEARCKPPSGRASERVTDSGGLCPTLLGACGHALVLSRCVAAARCTRILHLTSCTHFLPGRFDDTIMILHNCIHYHPMRISDFHEPQALLARCVCGCGCAACIIGLLDRNKRTFKLSSSADHSHISTAVSRIMLGWEGV